MANKHTSGAVDRPRGVSAGRQNRKTRVANHDRTALVRSIAHALVLKDADLFFLSDRGGKVRVEVLKVDGSLDVAVEEA